MDMSTTSSVVEPLFPSNTVPLSSSVSASGSSPQASYLGIIGQGSAMETTNLNSSDLKNDKPASFASILAESSPPTASSKPSKSENLSEENVTSTKSTSSKPRVTKSLDGRHGEYKVFIKNMKDFSVSEIQEILGDEVRSITLKLTNKQPNGMCHMTFRTKAGYVTALNRNYEVIAPSVNLSISKDTSNDSKFNIDNPVYFTYEDEAANYDASVLALPSFANEETTTSTGSTGIGSVLQSSLTGSHGDHYAFVRGLFYFNSYEVQSFLGDDVRSVTLKVDEDGRPNGMSHVTFNTQDGFNAAVARNNEYIRGKQQLRIAPDTKKDFANGSCRTVYFYKHGESQGKASKKERKFKNKRGTATSGNTKTSGGKSGGHSRSNGVVDNEWQTK